MSPLQQFNADCAWTPLYLLAGYAGGWWWVLALFVIHWAWNVTRKPSNPSKGASNER